VNFKSEHLLIQFGFFLQNAKDICAVKARCALSHLKDRRANALQDNLEILSQEDHAWLINVQPRGLVSHLRSVSTEDANTNVTELFVASVQIAMLILEDVFVNRILLATLTIFACHQSQSQHVLHSVVQTLIVSMEP
jgi:hypothetical protein